MAEMPTDYSRLIADIEARTERKRREADARGMGEAQRRGLVNPTGTSDIEMALRRSQTAPVVEAGETNIAGILGDIAEKERQRKYLTGEREATQGWQTGERVGAQGWQSGENVLNRKFSGDQSYQDRLHQLAMEGFIDPTKTTGYEGSGAAWTPYSQELGTAAQGKGRQLFGMAGANERQRTHDYGMMTTEAALNKPQKRKWYEGAIAPLAQGAATGATYSWLK